ncbi:MAG: hypothetical protein JWM68_2614 [Verrucomicrobiales bacterium]|nr:hypothetical protein [Verrucomicrobiales bacterium]
MEKSAFIERNFQEFWKKPNFERRISGDFIKVRVIVLTILGLPRCTTFFTSGTDV